MRKSFGKHFGVLFCALLIGATAFPTVKSFAAKGDLQAVTPMNEIAAPVKITLGKARILTMPGDVADVLVADSAVADVQAVKSNKLYVVGRSVGDTNLIILDSHGDVLKEIDLHVTYDLQKINSFLDERFPDEDVTVDAVHDQVVVMGEVSNPEVATQVLSLITAYVGDVQDEQVESPEEIIENLLKVRGQQQVMLKVRIVEASRTALRELGIQTQFSDFGINSSATSLALSPAGGIGVANDPAGVFNFLSDTGVSGIGNVQVLLSALEQENLVSVLAEPNLTTVSGQQAGFLAGGEFPVPVGRDQVGNLVIEFREFGVSLNFRPTVLTEERINLNLNTEVSSLDFVNVVSAGGGVIPGLDVRRAETTVEIASGSSMMIAGLLQSDALKNMAGLPGIKNTPVLGDLLSSNGFERNETELVVIVTPYLVQPYKEKSQAKVKPKVREYPLAKMFARNIRKSFRRYNEDLLALNESFGYILD